jgi:hypothetical protein
MYPVLDFVLCHGSFVNADHTYVHENKSVAPTPFALVEGTAHRRTLIVPADEQVDADLVRVGTLLRAEVAEVVATYSFDLRTRELQTQRIPNPDAGHVHVFAAYRSPGDPAEVVTMRDPRKVIAELQAAGADDDVD